MGLTLSENNIKLFVLYVFMALYDVVIVGAGPAGLSCADKLAKAGKKVIVLEKNKVVGPKICAGGIPTCDVDELEIPDKLLDYKLSEITLHTLLQTNVVRSPKCFLCTIDRESLGQWQLAKAKKSGAVVRTNSRVTAIGKNHVIVNDDEKIRFKSLVGADGSASLVRRHLGLGTDEVVSGIQYIIPSQKYGKFEIFLDSSQFNSWYCWIFPHKGYVSIGCGADSKLFSISQLRKNFERWLTKNNIDVSKGKLEVFPINSDYRGFKFGKIYLVGDAAGLAYSYSGEGIYQAFVSGEEIARMIVDGKSVSKKIDRFVKINRRHFKIVKFLLRSGPLRMVWYELLVFLLRSRQFRKVVRYIY